MGEVYLAEDTQLDRKVAIKFISRPESNEQSKKRLIREAKTAAKLDHPNICSVYEVAEEGNQSFIVMQYIEGETLADRIKRKALEIKESLDIAIQISKALAEAHSHGIIHRDIKSNNIMITNSGQVKMMDFGLAKWIEEKQEDQSKAETQSQLTGQGLVIGTIPYMSPEQVKGETLDARSDIFSFGVVLYEMIAGQRPFAAGSAAANASAILTEDPLPLSRYSPNIPKEVERIVRKCLEKDRNRRYQMIQETTIDLENAPRDSDRHRTTYSSSVSQRKSRLVGLTFVLIAFAIVSAILLTRKPVIKQPEIKSLAVLPLRNLSGDSTQEYFADGMTEALINNLAKIRALRVISRTSVMRYKDTRKSLPEIARELKVDAVIEGSVQRSGNRVRVTAQLIHAGTDANIWSREYEQDLTDVLKLQSDVAQTVADEIRIQVTPEERNRLASARTINPQAHESYLLGRYYTEIGNEQSWKQAIQYFERAIQLSPDYAPAHAGLSRSWLQLGIFGAKLREVESPARAAALKAIKLDDQLAEGYTALANIKYYCDWDWSGSEQEFKQALELDPGGLETHVAYGHFLMVLGRHNEAIKEGELSVQLDPVSAESRTALGRFLYRGRRYQQALPHLLKAVELEPRNSGANFRLGDVYVQLGDYDKALAAFEKGEKLTGDRDTFRCGIARVYALMNKKREALEMIHDVKGHLLLTAGVYAALGQKDKAFELLEKEVQAGNSIVVVLKEDPPFESLHSDPRWPALLRRMNFP